MSYLIIPIGVNSKHNGQFTKYTKEDKINYWYENAIDNYVILTDQRFIKIENGKIVSEVLLSDIKSIFYRNMGIFYYDKIEIIRKDNTIETFGIAYTIVTEFFTKVIQDNLKSLKENKNENKNENNENDCCLYILELEEDKKYIGRVDEEKDVDRRYKEHCNGTGALWTVKYKPRKIERIIPNSNIFDEDARVIEYMNKYKIENIRGGTYSQIDLNNDQIEEINNKIRGATDKCMKCGSSDHFIRNCVNNEKETKKEIKKEKEDLKEDYFVKKKENEEKKENICQSMVKKTGNPCVYKVSVNSMTGKYCHIHLSQEKTSISKDSCFRCGRNSHWVADCYAKTHLDGTKL